ncbi:zinc-ribbon domain-containing protein [Methanobrevibacter sp.]|uniref:zinc ribbon domain-containing protein n=1 Tax=Methanobrevibacter sp. TaxID=66852 RepID=UPI0038657790
MAKCNRCGIDITGDWNICPNCGNDLTGAAESPEPQSGDNITCSNCGATLKEDAAFCDKCGNKVDEANEVPKCEGCGSEIPENVLFCPTCGAKIEQKQPEINKECPNCGFIVNQGTTFCPECGSNIFTGEKTKEMIQSSDSDKGFVDKINLNTILKPTVITLIVSIILSSLGLLIGFSWVSFIIAIIISVGFFAGLVDNEANAIVMGAIVGLILGILENPLVEFWYGSFVAGLYEWFFGGQILLLIILGIICAYVSNVYLKKNIREIAGNFASWL